VLKWETAFAAAYRIETSLDNQNWSLAQTVTAGDGDTDDLSFAPVSARYVRMQGVTRATEYGYSIWEFEVYTSSAAAARQTIAGLTAPATHDTQFSIGVAPNPASNVLNVQFKGLAAPSLLRVFNISGQEVYQTRVSRNANQAQIDVSSWPKGMYIISVGDARKKVVVE
jgi:hypothetical protein